MSPWSLRTSTDRRAGLAFALALATACATTPDSEVLSPDSVKVRVGQIDPVALESATRSAPRSVAARTEQLVDSLWQAGCLGADVETRLPYVANSPDIVCSLRGRTENRIVVVTHLDDDEGDDGKPTHWSGVALLPFLYRSLAVEPREHTFVFAAFGKTPRNPRDYLARLGSPQGDSVRAIIDLQSIDPASIWFASSDAGLR